MAEIAFVTRESRMLAFLYKHASWLAGMPALASGAIEAIADQFAIAIEDSTSLKHISALVGVPSHVSTVLR